MQRRIEIPIIIKVNAKSKYLFAKLLPNWGEKKNLAEQLHEESTNDENTANILNEAGKVTKIYTKAIRNSYNFPVISEDAIILCGTEEANYKTYMLNLFKNLPPKPRP